MDPDELTPETAGKLRGLIRGQRILLAQLDEAIEDETVRYDWWKRVVDTHAKIAVLIPTQLTPL